MNRRDAALLAHLDAIEARLTVALDRILDAIEQLRAEVAGLKVDSHHHDDQG